MSTDPASLSNSELKNNYSNYGKHLYNSTFESAQLTAETVRDMWNYALGPKSPNFYTIEDLISRVDQDSDISATKSCDESGSYTYESQSIDSDSHWLKVNLNYCVFSDISFNGNVFARFQTLSNEIPQKSYFLNELESPITEGTSDHRVTTGYFEIVNGNYTDPSAGLQSSFEVFVEDQLNGHSYFLSSATDIDGSSGFRSIDGSVAFDTYGKIYFETGEHENSIIFRGTNQQTAEISTFPDVACIKLDENSDGILDSGRCFLTAYALAKADFSATPLVPLAELNYPPAFTRLNFSYSTYVGSEILINLSIQDEVPLEQLELTVRWAINGQPISAADDSLILEAANNSVAGELEATVTVFDGEFTVEQTIRKAVRSDI